MTLLLALFLPMALSFKLPIVRSRVVVMKAEAAPSTPADLDEGSCYLIDTDEGFVPHPFTQPASSAQNSALSRPGRRKYVCTDNPEELAWVLC